MHNTADKLFPLAALASDCKTRVVVKAVVDRARQVEIVKGLKRKL